MPLDLPTAAALVLACLWAATAALAGRLWARQRSASTALRAEVRDLADRLRALESRLSTPAPTLRRDRPAPAPSPGPTLIAVPDLSAQPVEHSEAAAELCRRFNPLWDLADAGATADAIARASGQPIGQVELILGLRRRLPRVTSEPEAAP